jgi:hypothetical protein
MSKNLFIILLVSVLVGCAHPRASSTVKEHRLINPDQAITILWDVGGWTTDNEMNRRIQQSGIHGKKYEDCTNAFFQRTFYKNGYQVKLIKLDKAELNAVPVDTPYVMVLNATGVVFMKHAGQLGALDMLNVKGALYDANSDQLLWQTKTHFSGTPLRNNHPPLHVLRALADDGFINRKIEDVVDYLGGQPTPETWNPKECPV